MINYSKLYNALGMNTSERFKNIRRHDIGEFQFPKSAIWHHVTQSKGLLEDPFFNNEVDTLIDPVTEFVTLSDRVIIKPIRKKDLRDSLKNIIIGRKNTSILRKSVSMVRSLNTIIIETYSGFENRFIFKDTKEEQYLKARSYLASVVSRIKEVSEYSERQHFIPVDLTESEKAPKSIFERVLKNGVENSNSKFFYSVDQCLILELLRFTEGQDSLFNDLTSKQRSVINFIFRGRFQESLLNLDEYSRMLKDETREESTGDISINKAKRTLLKLNLVLGTDDPEPEIGEEDDENTELDFDEVNEVETDDDSDETSDENDLETLEKISRKKFSEESIDIDASPDYEPSSLEPKNKTIKAAENLLAKNVISRKEFEKILSDLNSFDDIPSPDGKGTLKDFVNFGSEDLVIDKPFKFKDKDTVLDKGLLETTLKDFDSKYIKDFMHKDVVSFALGIQNADVIVKDATIEEKEDIANHWHQFTMQLVLVPGGPQTITFPIPVFDERGVTEVGGVNYYLKKQDGEVPIRKTKKNEVSLTSYYGKLFVTRSEAVAYSYNSFITKYIIAQSMVEEGAISDVRAGDVFYKHEVLPRAYSAVSEKVVSFKLTTDKLKTKLHFDYEGRIEAFGDEVKKVEKAANGIVVGKIGKDKFVLIDFNEDVITYKDNVVTNLGSFDLLIGASDKVPREFVTVNIFGKAIPLIFLLGYKIGLGTLCKRLGIRPRKVIAGGRLDMSSDEFRVRFKNESWIFNKKDKVASLLFTGLNKYEKIISRFSSSLFKDEEVYSLVIEGIGDSIGKRHYVEFKVIFDMFIDHITKDLLATMKEPTDMVNLFIRSCELLTNDSYPDEGDGAFMRLKGYERIAAAAYVEMIKAVRTMYRRSRSKRSRLDFNPMGVKMHLLKDSAKEVYDEINPIHALKQQEICTITGHGGRNSDAVSRNIKGYHKTDMGIKSEANVDSHAVGMTTYLTANPKLTSLRGTRGQFDMENGSVASLASTTFLTNLASDRDDMKRTVFAGIQNSHVIPCVGYKVPPVVTGYEQIIGQRTDDLFSYIAIMKGEVTRLNKRVIEVTYEDGSKKVCRLGRRYGKSKGDMVPHEIVTDLKLGDKVDLSDTIVYNKNFFVEDPMLGNCYKVGAIARMCYMDDKDSHEDSLAARAEFLKEMTSYHTAQRHVRVDFDKTIRNMLMPGDHVNPETKLMFIQADSLESTGMINQEAIDILSRYSVNAPSARMSGVIDKIEIRYRGNIDLMSPSLQETAYFLDKQLARDRKEENKKPLTNLVDETFRVDGNPIDNEQAVITFYITEEIPNGTGDKYVVGNQMKATTSRVITTKFEDEDGEPIDFKMAQKAFDARKVESTQLMGFMFESTFTVQDLLIEMLEE